jgi:hypothetical protein
MLVEALSSVPHPVCKLALLVKPVNLSRPEILPLCDARRDGFQALDLAMPFPLIRRFHRLPHSCPLPAFL